MSARDWLFVCVFDLCFYSFVFFDVVNDGEWFSKQHLAHDVSKGVELMLMLIYLFFLFIIEKNEKCHILIVFLQVINDRMRYGSKCIFSSDVCLLFGMLFNIG